MADDNDNRLTKFGKFLRMLKPLDEMPQFINVFLGDMSILVQDLILLNLNKKYNKELLILIKDIVLNLELQVFLKV